MRSPYACILTLLLAGCAQWAERLPPPPENPRERAWAARQALLSGRNAFALSGRLAVQRDAEGGQATLRWRQAGDAFELRIIAPLGQGTYRVTGDGQRVALAAPDGALYEASDLDTLMTKHLNWSLPVAGARFWVRGLPSPDRPYTQLSLDEKGRLTDLAQDGWRISVLAYQAVGDVEMPRKLFLLGDRLKMTLVVTQWTDLPE
ncbi:MAG: lipoprotein insertase outer membrane protein LolB [Gammaproteobacteria bacterium]